MKKFLMVAIFALFSSQAFAWGLSIESIEGWNNKTIKPIKYNISVNGNDLRVYEWVTPSKPYQKCVFVSSEHNTQLQCRPVNDDKLAESMIKEESKK